MAGFKLPEGFKLLKNRSTHPDVKKRHYALSEKGEILDLQSGKILIAPEEETVIEIRETSPGHQYHAEFDIPVLLRVYFGNERR